MIAAESGILLYSTGANPTKYLGGNTMAAMGEHMLNALIHGMDELKQEYSENPEKLTYKIIMTKVYKIVAQYTVDRKDILNLFWGRPDLTVNDIMAMKDLDYED